MRQAFAFGRRDSQKDLLQTKYNCKVISLRIQPIDKTVIPQRSTA